MSATPQDHFKFTAEEWSHGKMIEMLRIAFANNDINIVYDIGACAGGWSQVILENFIVKKIYCFEPARDSFDYLISKFIHRKVQCFNIGVYYGLKESKAYGRAGDSNIGARFVKGIDETGVELPMTFKLKELEELNIELPDLIKMDVEGAEKNIIENSSVVKNCKNLIIEWHDDSTNGQDFFEKFLPKHKVIYQISNSMYFLKHED